MGRGDLSGVFDAALWMGVLLVIVGGAVSTLLWFRRRVLRDADQGAAELSLSDLSRLRDTGKVSESEYAAIRTAAVRRMVTRPRGDAAASATNGFRGHVDPDDMNRSVGRNLDRRARME